jgi:HK97 family phage major capsid protein
MSIQALRERLNSQKAEARKLLDEKGSTTWTAEDKAKFDNLVDEAERTEQQIEAHQRLLDNRADEDFNDLPKAEPKAKKSATMQAAEIYMRTMSRNLTAEQLALIQNTMSTTTGSEGGFTVKSDVASSVIEAIASYAGIREVASRIVTAQGNPLSYPSSDGRTEEGEIIAENATASDADMAFGTVPLNVFKFSSKVIAIPIELLQDTTVDIVALLNKRVRDRIGRIQNRMMTAAGTGTGSPFALVSAAGVGKVGASGQTATVTYDDLIDLIDSIDEGYGEDGKRFMFGQTVRRIVRKIKDTAGRPIWTPSYDLGMSARTPDLLLGYPVQINNHMPAPAANAKSIAFGDLGQYHIRDAMDVTLFRFEDSAYLKKGQIGFLAWSRSGGNLLDPNAVKVYQHSAT